MTRKNKTPKVKSPPPTLPTPKDARLEMKYYRGKVRGVLVCGCGGFEEYTHECVAVRVGKERVEITGEELWCRSFGNRVAEVIGTIREIKFSGAKDG